MAIIRVPKGYEFIGLSTDTKPTDNVKLFSLFMESNTGDVYMWHYKSTNDLTAEWKKILD